MSAQLLLFAATAPTPQETHLLLLEQYDRVLVQWSGGKDSLACILYLLELGIEPARIELWHQRIDGASGEEAFMDWAGTDRYVQLVGDHLGLPVLYQYREGGFKRELFRENEKPAPVTFEREGRTTTVASVAAERNTRRKFPAPTADLSRRWCSASLKIDVAAKAIRNDLQLTGTRQAPVHLLVVSGERREESPARARYREVEVHRTNSLARVAHQWRPIIDWSEEEVWEIIRRHSILPHPAYLLGWNRTSCFGCIFSTPDLWAMYRTIAPERFERLARAEEDLQFTIDPHMSLPAKADLGKTDRLPPEGERACYLRWAMEPDALQLSDMAFEWPDNWYPRGAFHGHAGGSL